VGSDQAFQLKTEAQSFTFDKQLKHRSGKLYAADFCQNHEHIRREISLELTTMPFKEYHCLLGHANKHSHGYCSPSQHCINSKHKGLLFSLW
jgi:hypothetical protein